MELNEVIIELEALLDECGLDEAWSDWLRDCADKTMHPSSEQELRRFLCKLQDCEETFRQLHRYLPDSDQNGEFASKRLNRLINALDCSLMETLHKDTASVA
jgi:hypothetical protein